MNILGRSMLSYYFFYNRCKIAHLYRFESKSSVQSFLSSNFATLAARLLPYSNGSAANAE